MKVFTFTVRGRETFDVEAYEPCEGATFVAHRSRGGKGRWLVTHRGTTWIAHQPDINTRRAALDIAQRLHDGCPSAGKVKPSSDGKSITGPHQKLRGEIIEVLKSMGESLPRAA